MEALAVETQTVENSALRKLRVESGPLRFFAVSVSAVARNGLIWWAVSACLLRSGVRRHREAAVDGAAAWVVTEIAGSLLKQVIDRRRPAGGHGEQPESPSMPSTHTANAVAYAFAAGIRAPDCALPLGTLAATIAWSRLALNRHFPSDVLVGALLGSAVGVSAASAHRACDARRMQAKPSVAGAVSRLPLPAPDEMRARRTVNQHAR